MQSSQCMAIIGTNVLLSLIGFLLFFVLLENISLNEGATIVLYMKDKKGGNIVFKYNMISIIEI